jgi:hypothetical protein
MMACLDCVVPRRRTRTKVREQMQEASSWHYRKAVIISEVVTAQTTFFPSNPNLYT